MFPQWLAIVCSTCRLEDRKWKTISMNQLLKNDLICGISHWTSIKIIFPTFFFVVGHSLIEDVPSYQYTQLYYNTIKVFIDMHTVDVGCTWAFPDNCKRGFTIYVLEYFN
jgi:hypothetical protein